jgi:hypothetical protein
VECVVLQHQSVASWRHRTTEYDRSRAQMQLHTASASSPRLCLSSAAACRHEQQQQQQHPGRWTGGTPKARTEFRCFFSLFFFFFFFFIYFFLFFLYFFFFSGACAPSSSKRVGVAEWREGRRVGRQPARQRRWVRLETARGRLKAARWRLLWVTTV